MPVPGFIAGFASAFLGIGGGVVLVPSLVLFFDYEVKKAVGTSLATIVPAALVGVATNYLIKSDNIRFAAALLIVLGAIAGAKLGAVIANKISGRLLKTLFAVLLLFVGLKQMGVLNIPTGRIANIDAYPLLIILGLVAGMSSALFGIGGGIVMVPALSLLFGLSMHQAIATSLTVIVPTALAGAVFHSRLDNINIGAMRFLMPASLVGAVLGAVISNRLSPDILQFIFGILLIACAVKMAVPSKLP